MNTTLQVYDETGATLIDTLYVHRGLVWQEEVSFAGSMTFEVPLTDASSAELTDRRIVKVTEGGSVVFGCRLSGEGTSLAVDGRRWLRFENQPGLLSMLTDAVVEPEYGYRRVAADDRLFGFMSAEGDWYDAADWDTPVGVDYTAAYPTNVKRRHQDPSLSRYAPQWIAPSPGPNDPAAGGTIAYFRATATIATAGDYAVICTGDDYLEQYCDGERIYTSDRAVFFAWRQAETTVVPLTVGDHLFAASLENRPSASLGNVLGYVFVLIALDDNGDPTGSPILVSNETDWVCTTEDVGWRRAEVLLTCIDEAKDRATANPNGVSALTIGFDADLDSDSDAWDEDRGQYSLGVTSVSLLDVDATLTESEMNVVVDPATTPPTLNAYKRLGSDKSATVVFALGDAGGSLKQYDAAKSVARHTLAYTKLADGTRIATANTAGLTAYGRIEVGIDLGTANTTYTARRLAAAELARSAHPIIAPTMEGSTGAGPQWRTDWVLGDTVMGVDERDGGTMPVRILSITHYRDADVPRDVPEVVADPS